MTDTPDATLTRQDIPVEALRQSEERFRLLVESVGDYAIFMLDPNGNVIVESQAESHVWSFVCSGGGGS